MCCGRRKPPELRWMKIGGVLKGAVTSWVCNPFSCSAASCDAFEDIQVLWSFLNDQRFPACSFGFYGNSFGLSPYAAAWMMGGGTGDHPGQVSDLLSDWLTMHSTWATGWKGPVCCLFAVLISAFFQYQFWYSSKGSLTFNQSGAIKTIQPDSAGRSNIWSPSSKVDPPRLSWMMETPRSSWIIPE